MEQDTLIYKVRDKNTGLFLHRKQYGGWHLSKRGTVWKRQCDLTSSIQNNPHVFFENMSQKDWALEVVAFTLIQAYKSSIPQWMAAK